MVTLFPFPHTLLQVWAMQYIRHVNPGRMSLVADLALNPMTLDGQATLGMEVNMKQSRFVTVVDNDGKISAFLESRVSLSCLFDLSVYAYCCCCQWSNQSLKYICGPPLIRTNNRWYQMQCLFFYQERYNMLPTNIGLAMASPSNYKRAGAGCTTSCIAN